MPVGNETEFLLFTNHAPIPLYLLITDLFKIDYICANLFPNPTKQYYNSLIVKRQVQTPSILRSSLFCKCLVEAE